MDKLNLPQVQLNVKNAKGKLFVFDPFRKKHVALTPEELVRQHFLDFLVKVGKYPMSLISVEQTVNVNGLNQRADGVVYSKSGSPLVLIECKAPDVSITVEVLNQAIRYSVALNAPLLFLTNGMIHYYILNPKESNELLNFKELPDYEKVLSLVSR